MKYFETHNSTDSTSTVPYKTKRKSERGRAEENKNQGNEDLEEIWLVTTYARVSF